MQLTVIGSGTAAPQAERACSGYLLETGSVRALLDCGPGVVHAMARLDVAWQRLTHLVLTHFHNDHTGDVPFLFFAWKYGMLPARSAPLVVLGPAGTERLLQQMADVFGTHLRDTPFELTVDEVAPGDERRLDAVTRLAVAKTHHTGNSVAYRIEADGRSFCYTGDTGPSDDVALLAQGVDTLLVECSLPDDAAMDTHLTPRQVAAMARVALPKRLLLTHAYPQLDRATLPEQVRLGGWTAPTELAVDGARIEI